MNRNTLLAGALLLLLAAIFLPRILPDGRTYPETLAEVDSAAVDRVSITFNRDSVTLALRDGVWYIQGERELPADPSQVARLLELTRIHVADVVSFYTMYHRKPIGRHLVSLCRTLCCQLVGQEDLSAYLRQRLGLEGLNGTDASGTFTVEHVECLGACGAGPVVIIDGQYHERVTVEGLKALLDGLQSGDAPRGERTDG